MRITYPVFKSSIGCSNNPFINFVELLYHTILPCAVTYLAVNYNMPLMLIFVLIPVFIRIRPEEIKK